jgi:phage terminase small subunit
LAVFVFWSLGVKVSTPATEERYQRFIEHYLDCLNGTLAAQRAGYSAKTARQIGSQLLTKVDIRAEIERRLADRAMGKNEVLARLTDHAGSDMGKFVKVVEENKKTVLLPDLEGAARRGDMRLVKKIKFDAKGGVTIELYDAQRALATLAQVHKLIGKAGGGEDDGWDDDETEEEAERPVGDDEILAEAALAQGG